MKTPREIAESYWKAECARDTKAVLEHYHPDATFCPPGQKLVGHDQISTFYDASGEAFPGLKVDILHEVRNGDESCIEWYATLTDKKGNVFKNSCGGSNSIQIEIDKLLKEKKKIRVIKLKKSSCIFKP